MQNVNAIRIQDASFEPLTALIGSMGPPVTMSMRPKKKLDGQGRARREAARRRKSEWKVNVAIPNSSRSNGSLQITPKLYRFLS